MNSVLNRLVVEYPFPGLRPFQEGEEHLFFGRESQSDAMIDKLARTRFLAVIGTSGSGKSSLVNCGLCLGLHGGLMADAGTAWKTASCRPGDNPIASLARALAVEGVLFSEFTSSGMSLTDIIETNLRMSKLGIVDVFEQSRQSDNTNLLIIVDQFEELFRFQKTAGKHNDVVQQMRDDAVAFVKLLLTARAQSNKRIYVVLTMRSDFLGECTRIEGLAEAINEGQYLVPRMTREQRRLAIAGPIGVAGARIDDVLLTRLVNDLGDNPDQLSILQHALNRIWAHWTKQNDPTQPLNLKNYAAVGSLAHALDRHAEKAFAQLSAPRQQHIAQKLFRALTDKMTHAGGIRRPTSLAMLCELTDSSQDELIKVINVFRKSSRSFLMPPIDEDLQANTMVDISHESLMRMWQRLIRWAEEEATSAQTYRRLAVTAELYAQQRAGLWRDPDLQLALEWRQQNEPNATWASRIAPGFDKAMQFLDDSRAKSDEEKAAQLQVAEQQRELEHARAIAGEQEQRILAQKKAATRQKRFLSSIIAGLVAILWLGTEFIQERREVTEKETLLSDKESELTNIETELTDKKTELTQEKIRSDALIESVVHKQGTLSQAESTTAVLAAAIRYHQAQATATAPGSIQSLREFATNNSKITNEIWQLIRNNKLAIYETPAVQLFNNKSISDHQIFILNEAQGLQSDPVVIPAGKTLSLDGFVNQIWIARALPDFSVTATGVVHENAEPVVFK